MRTLLTTLLTSLTLTLALTACGSFDVNIDDVEAEARVSGETYSYIIVRLEFISQLIDLCSDLILDQDFETVQAADQARAQCVFDKIESINFDLSLPEIEEDLEALCSQPPEELTPEQLVEYNNVCGGLGFL